MLRRTLEPARLPGGQFSLVADNDRELYITIEGDGFQIALAADPKKQAEARAFAARYNTLAARQAAGREKESAAPVDAVVSAEPVPSMPDVVERLERLAGLARDGVLTPDEFAAAKARLLGQPAPQDQPPPAW
jgi:hypothetical protein